MFRIYISETALRKALASERGRPAAERSNLYRILLKQSSVFTTTATPNLAWIHDPEMTGGITVSLQCARYISGIVDHPETVLEHPSSLFILDVTPQRAEEISRDYGVLCLSAENPDASVLIDMNDEHTTGEHEPLGEGWRSVLEDVAKLPSNSLLLCDRYLFKHRSARQGNGFDNVLAILNRLLPSRLKTDYHVTVVFDLNMTDESYTFEKIVNRLEGLKGLLGRDYPICMEVLGITKDCAVYNKMHNRRIVSNYFMVKAEHKLAAFDKRMGTCMQSITPQTLFTIDSLESQSTSPLKSLNQTVAALRQFSTGLHDLLDHTVYRYACDGQCLRRAVSIKNRIING